MAWGLSFESRYSANGSGPALSPVVRTGIVHLREYPRGQLPIYRAA